MVNKPVRMTCFFVCMLILLAPVVFGSIEKEIEEFGIVEPGFYRGAQPTEVGLRLLKEMGVRTLINFRHEKEVIDWERKKSEELGLKYVSLPWRIQWQPSPEVMKKFLQLVEDKKEGPFFMHCRRGAERTGVADALYRHYHQKKSVEEAFELATKGYHTRFYWWPFIRMRYDDFLKDLGEDRVI